MSGSHTLRPAPAHCLKSSFPESIKEFGSYEHEIPVLLAWCATVNVTFLHHSLVSVGLALYGKQTQIWLGNMCKILYTRESCHGLTSGTQEAGCILPIFPFVPLGGILAFFGDRISCKNSACI